jgi:hypothetical protein
VRKYNRTSRDPENLFWYSDVDREELCRHTIGGTCDRRP